MNDNDKMNVVAKHDFEIERRPGVSSRAYLEASEAVMRSHDRSVREMRERTVQLENLEHQFRTELVTIVTPEDIRRPEQFNLEYGRKRDEVTAGLVQRSQRERANAEFDQHVRQEADELRRELGIDLIAWNDFRLTILASIGACAIRRSEGLR